MKRILITGIAGSGKSTISDELKKLGYKSYDIEKVDGLFEMIDRNTGENIEEHNNDDLEEIKRRDWVCNINKLQKLLNSQKDDIVFYCGMATNILELSKLFDEILILKTSPETIRKRLSLREPGGFGETKEVQDWILEGGGWLEKMKWHKEPLIINSEKTPRIVAETILNKI